MACQVGFVVGDSGGMVPLDVYDWSRHGPCNSRFDLVIASDATVNDVDDGEMALQALAGSAPSRVSHRRSRQLPAR